MNEWLDSAFERSFSHRLRRDLDAGLPPLDAMEAARTARLTRAPHLVRRALAAVTVVLAALVTVGTLQLMGVLDGSLLGNPPADDTEGVIMVAVGESVQVGQVGDELLGGFNEAYQFALDHPADLGWPWVDSTSGELVLSAASMRGRSLLEAAAANLGVPYRIREVAHSVEELRRIQEAVTRLRAEGVVDAHLIFQTLPDERDNRTLIALTAMSEQLVQELVERFGADAIAIRVDPSRGPAVTTDS